MRPSGLVFETDPVTISASFASSSLLRFPSLLQGDLGEWSFFPSTC